MKEKYFAVATKSGEATDAQIARVLRDAFKATASVFELTKEEYFNTVVLGMVFHALHENMKNAHEIVYDRECLAAALAEDPQGKFCARCGKLNTDADDCGFWYCWWNGQYVAVCLKCMGEMGHHSGDR